MTAVLGKAMSEQNLTLIDLFCGAGGLSVGFAQVGFVPVRALDLNPYAIATYNSNIAECALRADLSDAGPHLQAAVVMVGGPPCQGFSSAGMRRPTDHRNSLVGYFSAIVAKYRPDAFVFENVEGFLTSSDGDYLFDLLIPLLEVGYRIHLRKINAANYGVPQHRKRVIAIGGLGWDPTFPEGTHTAFGAPGALLASRNSPLAPTLLDALKDLRPASTQPPGVPQGHFYKPLAGIDLQRAKALKPGQTMRDMPPELQHPSYQRRAFRRVMDGTPTERRGGAPAGLRRLRGDEPAKAITSGALSEFLHPIEDRTLTLRECAKLQTFADTFVFAGTQAQQAQLIGDAVPPLLARAIARQLVHDLEQRKAIENKGALLSFVPTLSNGCSPALRRIIDNVEKELGSYLLRKELLWR